MPSNLRYTKDHEAVKIEGNIITVGITEFACNALGDLVYIELPESDIEVNKGDHFAVVESVKTASEIYSPVTGRIIAVNESLSNNPELLKEAIDKGWIVKIEAEDVSELDDLLDDAEYKSHTN